MAGEKYKEIMQHLKYGMKIEGLNQVVFNQLEDEFDEDMEQKIRYYLFRKSLNIKHTYTGDDDAIKPYKVEGFGIEEFLLNYEDDKRIKKLNLQHSIDALFNNSIMEYALVSAYEIIRDDEIYYDAIILATAMFDYGELVEIAKIINVPQTLYHMDVYPQCLNPYYEQPCSNSIVIILFLGRTYKIDYN